VLDEETGIMTARLDAAFREVIGRDIQKFAFIFAAENN
jgi:hypothetical protein